MSVIAKPLLRISDLVRCERKAVYSWEGAPARERTPQEEGHLWRGKSVARDYTCLLATQSGAKIWVDSGHDFWVPPDLRAPDRESAGIHAETQIPWALGVGHSDIYIVETKTIVEILSSAHPTEANIRPKQRQAVCYTLHHPTAENCAVVIVNPSDLSTERIVMSPASTQYREIEAEVRERIDRLQRWEKNGELPGRVCVYPSDARQHFCMHAAHCFDGWEPPTLEEITADETVMAAVETLAQAKQARQDLGRNDKAWEAKQKEAQAVLEHAGLPTGDSRVGSFKVTRTDVQRAETFDWKKAELAGRFEPGLLAEFFKSGASYSTYKVARIHGEAEDYGDDIPWEA